MTPPELFGVLIRVLGIWILFFGIHSLCSSVYQAFLTGSSSYVVGHELSNAVPEFLVGLYLIGGANSLTRFCFPSTRQSETTQNPNAHNSPTS